jgi:hypothetical protein
MSVGDQMVKSNLTRRVDFALFMVEALENDELVHARAVEMTEAHAG